MDENIAQRTMARLDELPASERKVAQTLMANYPMAGLKTVAELSKDAGVSAPTVLRFLARIGFQTYGDFQDSLKEELSARLQSPLARSDRLGRRDRSTTPAFMRAITDNIAETFAHVGDEQFDAITRLLGDRRRPVYLVGGRLTDPLACYFAAHLRIIRPHVVHLDGQESGWRDRLLDMTRSNVLVVFDIRRYQSSLGRFAEAAAQRRVTVILFTDQWLSPIARIARHVIAARTSVPSPWDSNTAMFALIEAILGKTTEDSAPASVKRIRQIEHMGPFDRVSE